MTHEKTSPVAKKPVSSTLLAANIQSVIDPEWTLPGLPAIMNLASQETLSHLLDLLSNMEPDALRLVYRATSGELLMTEGRSAADVVGVIHLSAVLAPVFIAIANHENIEVNQSEFTSTFEDIRKNVKTVWKCDAGEFRLHETHRFYYVRGLALFILKQSHKGLNTALSDAKLDRHIMWVGSRFEDLIPNLDVLVVGNDFSRDFISAVANNFEPEDDQPKQERKPVTDYDEFIKTYEERTGYDKTGRYSPLPEHSFRNTQLGFPSVRLVSGIHLFGGDYEFIRHTMGEDFQTQPFMLTLTLLIEDLVDTEFFAGEVALAFMHFRESALKQIALLCSEYSVEDRQALFEYLSMECTFRDPTQPLFVTEFKARIATFAAPAVRAFFDASYTPEPLEEFECILEADDFASVESYEAYLEDQQECLRKEQEDHDQKQADHRSDQIIDEMSNLIEFWLENCDAACANDTMEEYIAKVRILAIMRGAQIEYTPEYETYMEDLIAKVDAICRNAKLITETKDLSLNMLRKLK